MAGDSVAEVVAVVRADTSEYEREMRKTDASMTRAEKSSRSSERASVDGANRTAAALGRVRLGWIGVAAAIGTANNLLSRGPLANARAQQRGLALDRIGDQLFRGTGLDDLSKATNDRLFDLARGLKRTREADPTGQGNLGLGLIGSAQNKAIDTVRKGDFDRGFEEANQGGFFRRAGTFLGGVAGIPISTAGALIGDTQGAIEGIERSRGRIVGSFGRGARSDGAPQAPAVLTKAHFTIAVEGLNDEAFKTDLKSLVDRHLEERLKQNMAGGYSG